MESFEAGDGPLCVTLPAVLRLDEDFDGNGLLKPACKMFNSYKGVLYSKKLCEDAVVPDAVFFPMDIAEGGPLRGAKLKPKICPLALCDVLDDGVPPAARDYF